MMKVTIYIETSLAGPGTRNGGYGAVVEFLTKKGEPVTREVYGTEEETTWYKSVLTAAVQALKLLIHPCDVELVTGCVFIVNMISKGNVESWARNGWMASSGEEVKMKALWKRLYSFMSIHKIAATFSKHHAYKHFLLENIKKETNKRKC